MANYGAMLLTTRANLQENQPCAILRPACFVFICRSARARVLGTLVHFITCFHTATGYVWKNYSWGEPNSCFMRSTYLSGTVYIRITCSIWYLFILQYSWVYMDQLELVFWLLVCLQFTQYSVYLSIVVRTNIVFFIIIIYMHMIQNNLRTPQLVGKPTSWGTSLVWLS